MDTMELRRQRAKLLEDARADMAVAERAERDWTAEEQEKWDRRMAEIDRLKDVIDCEEAAMVESGVTIQDGVPSRIKNIAQDQTRDEKMAAFFRYLRVGTEGLSGPELRALQADSATAGGYILPQAYGKEIIEAKEDLVWMRKIAQVLPPLETSDSIGNPSLDANPADAVWTAEIGETSEDSTMAFGKRELRPHPLAKLLKISRKLVRLAGPAFESYIKSKLSYKISVPEENGFLNGSGNRSPLGIFVASNSGISTSRDVSTGNTATTVMPDNYLEVTHTLKKQYRASPGIALVTHRDYITKAILWKDGNGKYFDWWKPALVPGMPDTLLGYPVYESEYAPSTFETGLYVGVFGDFQQYWIQDCLRIEVQVLTELYARTGQYGYIIRSETDAMPIDENAFVRIKMG